MEPKKGHRSPVLKNLEESPTSSPLDMELIDHVVRIGDGPTYDMTKRLFREHGLTVASSWSRPRVRRARASDVCPPCQRDVADCLGWWVEACRSLATG